MVEEHDNLLPSDLLASVQNQIDDCLKMCFAGCQMSWVDVICFESCKIKLTRSYIITDNLNEYISTGQLDRILIGQI